LLAPKPSPHLSRLYYGSKHEKDEEKTRQAHSITVTNLGDRVRVTGGGIPPIVACSLLFEAFVEVSKSFGMSRQDVAEQLRDYARQIQAMSDDEYNSGIRRPIH
jgi:hypothetical protein